MFKRSLAVSLGVACLAASSEAAVLARYEFPSGAATATSADPSVTAGSFTFVSSWVGGTGFSSAGSNAFTRSNATGTAINTAWYLGFALAPTTGNELDLESLTFDYGANTGSAIQYTMEVRAKPASSSIWTSLGTVQGDVPATTAISFTPGSFSMASFTDVQESVDVRFYFYDNVDDGNSIMRIDNVTVLGTVGAVPEPTLLGAITLSAFGLLRRKPKA